jgi:L-lactate dehydrogenase
VGAGTILDTARLRYELGANCGVDPRNVHAYVIGEHGDSEVPLWSLTNVAGMGLRQFCAICGRECSPADLDAIFHRVRDAAYKIIALKGATYYAIALGTTRMIEAILRDQHTVITASTLLQGQYGIQDVCLSLPVVLGLGGVQRVIEAGISEQEQEALQKSAKVLRGVLDNFSF